MVDVIGQTITAAASKYPALGIAVQDNLAAPGQGAFGTENSLTLPPVAFRLMTPLLVTTGAGTATVELVFIEPLLTLTTRPVPRAVFPLKVNELYTWFDR